MSKIGDKRLRIVFFGDIVGKPGRRGVAFALSEIRKSVMPDLVVGNIENSAHGKGVTEKTLSELLNLGFDGFTSGEHIYDKLTREVAADLFKKFPNLVKPANFSLDKPGRGEYLIEHEKGSILVVNLIGQVFFWQNNFSPWDTLSEILVKYQSQPLGGILIDFHAEATSEKVAFGQYFDGRVSAILGTHTHIPTADATILPHGTAFVTDVGMNGPIPSVLGMKSEVSINRFLTGEKLTYEIAESNQVWLNYVIIDIDTSTQKATNIEHKHEIIELT